MCAGTSRARIQGFGRALANGRNGRVHRLQRDSRNGRTGPFAPSHGPAIRRATGLPDADQRGMTSGPRLFNAARLAQRWVRDRRDCRRRWRAARPGGARPRPCIGCRPGQPLEGTHPSGKGGHRPCGLQLRSVPGFRVPGPAWNPNPNLNPQLDFGPDPLPPSSNCRLGLMLAPQDLFQH